MTALAVFIAAHGLIITVCVIRRLFTQIGGF